MKTIQIQIDVRVPCTINDWQLYDLPGAELAAAEMTKLLLEAVECFRKTLTSSYSNETAKKTLRDVWKWLDAKLDTYSKYGSRDTEPVGIAARYLCELCSLVAFGRRNGFDDMKPQ